MLEIHRYEPSYLSLIVKFFLWELGVAQCLSAFLAWVGLWLEPQHLKRGSEVLIPRGLTLMLLLQLLRTLGAFLVLFCGM